MTEKLKTDSTAPNKIKIGKKLGEIGFALLPVLGAEASHDTAETRTELQSATEVAQRFNCKVTAAEDTHIEPPIDRFRGEKRTTVQVTIEKAILALGLTFKHKNDKMKLCIEVKKLRFFQLLLS